MITAAQIAQGAITDTKVGKNANIKHSKLEKAGEGEVLVAQEDGRLKAVRISGDARLSRTGKLTVNVPEIELPEIAVDESVLRKTDLKQGKTLVGGPSKPEEVAVGSGANAIPQRDSSGNLKAETADQATTATNATNADNATLLNGNNMEYYRNVANHNYGSSTNLTTDDGGIAGTSTPKLHKIITATNSGQSSPTEYTVEHDLGYQPQVTVLADTDDNGDYYEIDAEVKSETDKVTVKVSTQSVPLKIICS